MNHWKKLRFVQNLFVWRRGKGWFSVNPPLRREGFNGFSTTINNRPQQQQAETTTTTRTTTAGPKPPITTSHSVRQLLRFLSVSICLSAYFRLSLFLSLSLFDNQLNCLRVEADAENPLGGCGLSTEPPPGLFTPLAWGWTQWALKSYPRRRDRNVHHAESPVIAD